MAVVLAFGTAAVMAMRTALKLKRNAKVFVLNPKESVSSTINHHFETSQNSLDCELRALQPSESQRVLRRILFAVVLRQTGQTMFAVCLWRLLGQ